MAKKIHSPYQALCVFAKKVDKVSMFYQQALGLKVEVSDKTHDLLVGQNYEVVVHAISKVYAQSIEIQSPPNINRLDLNRATLQELENTPYLNREDARKIIAHRTRNKGINEAFLSELFVNSPNKLQRIKLYLH